MLNPSQLNLRNNKKRKRPIDDGIEATIVNLLKNETDKITLLFSLLDILKINGIFKKHLQIDLEHTGASNTLKRISELSNPNHHKNTEKRKYNDIQILIEYLSKIPRTEQTT